MRLLKYLVKVIGILSYLFTLSTCTKEDKFVYECCTRDGYDDGFSYTDQVCSDGTFINYAVELGTLYKYYYDWMQYKNETWEDVKANAIIYGWDCEN